MIQRQTAAATGSLASSNGTTPVERLGRYRLIGRIATGGMAELHLGQLVGPGGFEQYVAIKRILPHLAREPAFVAMFTDEANIAARIRHPNVVSILELGQEDEQLFLAMEYLIGEPLSALVRRMAGRNARLPPELALHVITEVSKGLQAAHDAVGAGGANLGIVHRDISPQNILVTFDGTVKIVDFGIAKAADRVTKTDTGTFKGKLGYTAPEQFEGREVDARADVFSLGAVLYETLTGTRLFKRKTQAATLRATLEGSITPPSEVVPALGTAYDTLCARAVALNPDERFQSAEELRHAVLAVSNGIADAPSVLATLMKDELADRHAMHLGILGQAAAGQAGSSLPLLPPHDLADILDAPVTTGTRRTRRAALVGVFAAVAAFAFLLLATSMFSWWQDSPEAVSVRAHVQTQASGPPETTEVPEPSESSGQAGTTEATEATGASEALGVVRLRVISRPSRARVTLDDRFLGTTPLEVDVEATPEATLVVSKPGRRSVRRSVDLSDDRSLSVSLRRRPAAEPFRPWVVE